MRKKPFTPFSMIKLVILYPSPKTLFTGCSGDTRMIGSLHWGYSDGPVRDRALDIRGVVVDILGRMKVMEKLRDLCARAVLSL